MAGLLDTVARGLLGGKGKDKKQTVTIKRATYETTPKTTEKIQAAKPAAKSTANEWVKNATIEQPITAIDRTVKPERTQENVEREDYLLTQIDEFREKAKQLQDLLLSKESKVMELQNIVDEREVKAKELELILDERQRKADGITAEVAKQIDDLIGKVTAKMDELGVSIEGNLAEGQKISAEQMEELKETFATVNEQLETLKTELSEKVHSENVRSFRNISDLFKSMDEKVDSIQKSNTVLESKVKAVHKCTIALIVLTVINMLGIIACVLLGLGIF